MVVYETANRPMHMNAFTCTGAYAILILYGIKQTENRSAWPELREGRAAISCSKSFCREEYGQFIAWASVNLSPEDFEKLPAWREVKNWPGKIVGVCDYKARDGFELVLDGSWSSGNQSLHFNGMKDIVIGGIYRMSNASPNPSLAAAMSVCGSCQNPSRQKFRRHQIT